MQVESSAVLTFALVIPDLVLHDVAITAVITAKITKPLIFIVYVLI